MAKTKAVNVRFLVRDAPYDANDVVAFPQPTAARLVASGVAEFFGGPAAATSTLAAAAATSESVVADLLPNFVGVDVPEPKDEP